MGRHIAFLTALAVVGWAWSAWAEPPSAPVVEGSGDPEAAPRDGGSTAAGPHEGAPAPAPVGIVANSSAPSTATTSATPAPRMRLAAGFARRGAIRDRVGRLLVADVPCWDIALRYELLVAAADPAQIEVQKAYVTRLSQQIGLASQAAGGPSGDKLIAHLQKSIDRTWTEIRAMTGASKAELARRCERSVAQVKSMKAAVVRARGKEVTIAEEKAHRIVARVFGEAAGQRVVKKLKPYHWVRLIRSTARHSEGMDSLVHVLGRVGRADERRAAADPSRQLQVGESCGVTGAERLGDSDLRPRLDASGMVRDGVDVRLTIDAELQRDVHALVDRAVSASTYPCGGAAVVIHVPTGEVRALVSAPSHPYELSTSESRTLAEDARWTPLRFRAVSSVFPPGSTIKPVTLYAALAEGAVTMATKVPCTGSFREDVPDAFRCWVFNRSGSTHGTEDGETALRDSCNIYFYSAGDKLGADALIRHFGQIGVGATQGTGLIEESPGLLPTPAWLAAHRRVPPRFQRSDAWNYAFGQGELGVTPLQMANIAATLARSRYMPVTLMAAGDGTRGGAPKVPSSPLDERWMKSVRRGLWRVVNEKGGTADVARIPAALGHLVGKTGSAQAMPRVLARRYVFDVGGKRKSIEAGSLERAKAALGNPAAKLVDQSVSRRYPTMEDGELPSHAWFIGYTQPPGTERGASPTGDSYALGVLIEYGGGGGKVAGPLARDIAVRLLSTPRPTPDPSASPGSPLGSTGPSRSGR